VKEIKTYQQAQEARPPELLVAVASEDPRRSNYYPMQLAGIYQCRRGGAVAIWAWVVAVAIAVVLLHRARPSFFCCCCIGVLIPVVLIPIPVSSLAPPLC
jgi:hypothetical protein